MRYSVPLLSVRFEREEIPVRTFMPRKVPDEKWRYVDKVGHGHFWSGKELPTLEWVVTGTEWVGDEIDGEEIEVGEYRCRQCGEVIEPRKRTSHEPDYILGPTVITLEIGGESFLLTEEQYAVAMERLAQSLRELRDL